MKEVTKLYDELVELGLFTKDELQLVTNMCGYNVETLNNAVYARYGYNNNNRDAEQFINDVNYVLNYKKR